MKIKMS